MQLTSSLVIYITALSWPIMWCACTTSAQLPARAHQVRCRYECLEFTRLFMFRLHDEFGGSGAYAESSCGMYYFTLVKTVPAFCTVFGRGTPSWAAVAEGRPPRGQHTTYHCCIVNNFTVTKIQQNRNRTVACGSTTINRITPFCWNNTLQGLSLE